MKISSTAVEEPQTHRSAISSSVMRSWILSSLIAALTLFFIALWTIDISVSALLVSGQGVGSVVVTNGFHQMDPTKLYHVALWVAIGSFVWTSITAIQLLTGLLFPSKQVSA